jgi:hypothetical protein
VATAAHRKALRIEIQLTQKKTTTGGRNKDTCLVSTAAHNKALRLEIDDLLRRHSDLTTPRNALACSVALH